MSKVETSFESRGDRIAASVYIPDGYTERFVEAKPRGITTIKIIDGARHIQAYDVPEYVSQGTDALAEFFNDHLGA